MASKIIAQPRGGLMVNRTHVQQSCALHVQFPIIYEQTGVGEAPGDSQLQAIE